MTRQTHIEFGYAVLVLIILFFGTNFLFLGLKTDAFIVILVWIVGACLPDADHVGSEYGQKLRFMGKISLGAAGGAVVFAVLYWFILHQFIWQFVVAAAGCVMFSLFSKSLKHRGIMHSIWIPLLLMAIAYIGTMKNWFGEIQLAAVSSLVGVSGGYLTHLLADMFNPDGVKLFQPIFKGRFRVARILTGSDKEKKFLKVARSIQLGALTALLLYRLIMPLAVALMS
ncbi:MAG: metal-dependent hydrolase [Clostridiales bacterium]|jgi:membrane-bound metal-dependent hydrolase YbcI (DUF457 family)|nr:metal-dependent hydrolase [Clostridiales bacterium]